MPITPTSTKSKQYQALGIDEIANDIETVFDSVNTLETDFGLLQTEVNNLPSAPTTAVVNISATQIKAGGNINLLPDISPTQYYVVESIIIESSAGTDYQNVIGNYLVLYGAGTDLAKTQSQNINGQYIILLPHSPLFSDTGENYVNGLDPSDSSYKLYFTATPTVGTRTLRAIITYTTRTFGA